MTSIMVSKARCHKIASGDNKKRVWGPSGAAHARPPDSAGLKTVLGYPAGPLLTSRRRTALLDRLQQHAKRLREGLHALGLQLVGHRLDCNAHPLQVG